MSHLDPSQKIKKKTLPDFRRMKQSAEKISMVTCYDSSFAKLVEKSPVDAVLVGDSLGNVMLGQKNTLAVTMSDMCRHTRAVSQVLSRPFLIADMPFMSYQLGRKQALKNAGILIAEGGAAAVKLEGGQEILPQVRALTAAGIPVCGHLGLTPQKIHQLVVLKFRAEKMRPAELSRRMLWPSRMLEFSVWS